MPRPRSEPEDLLELSMYKAMTAVLHDWLSVNNGDVLELSDRLNAAAAIAKRKFREKKTG